MKKVLVLASGGLDSTVLMYMAIKEVGAENVVALNAYYGQKHEVEIEMFHHHCDKNKLEAHTLELSSIMQFNKDCSALLQGSSKEIAHESYAEQLEKTDIVSAYVPYRNGLFLSVAASVAYQTGCDTIAYGAHADDAIRRNNGSGTAAYPDCTKAFIEAQAKAIEEGTAGKVTLWSPLWNCTKAEVVGKGIEAGMTRDDFTWTHSCYEGIRGGCGTCGTCRDRNAALNSHPKTKGAGQTGFITDR